ncbi:hypothetical protein ACFWN5_14810 [Streptomyces sp. NPDC058430]|uniref:hypothetical protein n=1 Tax=unclassified Streptomyces TaxID=2593676 RepID=UPI00364B14DA
MTALRPLDFTFVSKRPARLYEGRQPTDLVFTATEGGARHSAASTPAGGSPPWTLSTPPV